MPPRYYTLGSTDPFNGNTINQYIPGNRRRGQSVYKDDDRVSDFLFSLDEGAGGVREKGGVRLVFGLTFPNATPALLLASSPFLPYLPLGYSTFSRDKFLSLSPSQLFTTTDSLKARFATNMGRTSKVHQKMLGMGVEAGGGEGGRATVEYEHARLVMMLLRRTVPHGLAPVLQRLRHPINAIFILTANELSPKDVEISQRVDTLLEIAWGIARPGPRGEWALERVEHIDVMPKMMRQKGTKRIDFNGTTHFAYDTDPPLPLQVLLLDALSLLPAGPRLVLTHNRAQLEKHLREEDTPTYGLVKALGLDGDGWREVGNALAWEEEERDEWWGVDAEASPYPISREGSLASEREVSMALHTDRSQSESGFYSSSTSQEPKWSTPVARPSGSRSLASEEHRFSTPLAGPSRSRTSDPWSNPGPSTVKREPAERRLSILPLDDLGTPVPEPREPSSEDFRRRSTSSNGFVKPEPHEHSTEDLHRPSTSSANGFVKAEPVEGSLSSPTPDPGPRVKSEPMDEDVSMLTPTPAPTREEDEAEEDRILKKEQKKAKIEALDEGLVKTEEEEGWATAGPARDDNGRGGSSRHDSASPRYSSHSQEGSRARDRYSPEDRRSSKAPEDQRGRSYPREGSHAREGYGSEEGGYSPEERRHPNYSREGSSYARARHTSQDPRSSPDDRRSRESSRAQDRYSPESPSNNNRYPEAQGPEDRARSRSYISASSGRGMSAAFHEEPQQKPPLTRPSTQPSSTRPPSLAPSRHSQTPGPSSSLPRAQNPYDAGDAHDRPSSSRLASFTPSSPPPTYVIDTLTLHRALTRMHTNSGTQPSLRSCVKDFACLPPFLECDELTAKLGQCCAGEEVGMLWDVLRAVAAGADVVGAEEWFREEKRRKSDEERRRREREARGPQRGGLLGMARPQAQVQPQRQQPQHLPQTNTNRYRGLDDDNDMDEDYY